MMSLKVIFVLSLIVVACECHYGSWDRYLRDEHPEESKGSCSKANACAVDQVCCLHNSQGHCFVNHLTIVNSDICLTADELAGYALGDRCQNDGDCGSGLWCEHNRSNVWGTCVHDSCSGDADGICGDYGDCNPITEGHGYECSCDNGWVGSMCNTQHPCETSGLDAVCGTNGYCDYKEFASSVYPEDLTSGDYFTCTCKVGWIGDRCNHGHPCYTSSDPCKADGGVGKCYVDGEGYGCYCELNLYGQFCNETCGSSSLITDVSVNITNEIIDGVITTPGLNDGTFPNDVTCEWKFALAATGKKVKIEFTAFDLEYHPVCKWDNVVITQSDGSELNGSVGYCGSLADLTNVAVESADNTMTIIFKSDRIQRRNGFTATLSEEDP